MSDVREYYRFLHNTGGNDPEELVSRLSTDKYIAQTNLIVFTMAISVDGQINLLKRLKEQNLLKETQDVNNDCR